MKEMSDIGVERSQQGCGQSIRRTVMAVLCFYLCAGLFNGESIRRDLELMPYGNKREICLALVQPLAWISRVSHLGDFRIWLEGTLHKEPGT